MESLYRRYRPLTFDSVVGQQHIVSTLEHAIAEGRLSHAYLFCGPRGTGKTTMARILAKALLCEKSAAAREGGASGCMPDGTCPECVAIAEGNHPDVYELDAASRTGVESVRSEIIDSVNFGAVRGAYKVYIIDEVHMLSTAAFNALLKTLEEPPSHVIFVMCTTDPQKIPETILSRCQRFEFHRISNDDIIQRLTYICSEEGFAYDEEALRIVAKHARGGMRDALSTLEQLSVFGDGAINVSDARSLLGEVPGEVLSEFTRGIAERDVSSLFGLVRAQVDEGNDIMELTRDLVAHIRDVYMVRVAGTGRDILNATPAEMERLAEEAELFDGTDQLARALTVLDDAALEMRTATDLRVVFEIALTRLARPKADLTLEALADRLDRLEAQLASGAVSVAAPEAAPMSPAPAPAVSGAAAQPDASSHAAKAEASPASARVSKAAGGAKASTPKGWKPWNEAVSAASTTPAPAAAESPATSAKPTPVFTPVEAAAARSADPASSPKPTVSAPVASAAPTSPAAPAATTSPAKPAAPAPAAPAAAVEKAAPTTADSVDTGELQRKWHEVRQRVTKQDPPRAGLLLNARALADDGEVLTVGLPPKSNFAMAMLSRADSQATISAVVAEVFGERRLEFVTEGAAPTAPKQPSPEEKPVSESSAAEQPSPAPSATQPAAEEASQRRVETQPSAAVQRIEAQPSIPQRAEVQSSTSAASDVPVSDHGSAADAPVEPASAAAVDQTSGPTVLPEPDLERDRQAWEDDVVPYDEELIDQYDQYASGSSEDDLPPFDMGGEVAEPAPMAEAPAFEATPADAASPEPASAPVSVATPAPSVPPTAGFNFVQAQAAPDVRPQTEEESRELLESVFGVVKFEECEKPE